MHWHTDIQNEYWRGNHFNYIFYLDFRKYVLDQVINAAIAEAISDAKKLGVVGKEATPFLLTAIARKTEGKSLKSSKNAVCDCRSYTNQLWMLYDSVTEQHR